MLRRTFLGRLFSRKTPEIPAPIFQGTKSVRKTIEIREAGTYDFKNVLHEWKGEKWGRDREYGSPVLQVFVSDVTVKNFAYAGSPDGVHVGALAWSSENAVREADTVENVRFIGLQAIDIREDAVTLQMGTQNVSLENCQFWGALDKVVQNDHCKELRVEECSFYGGARPLRFKANTSGIVRNCLFLKNAQAIKADGLPWPKDARGSRRRPGGTSRIRVRGCLFYRSSIAALDAGKDAYFDEKWNTFIECKRRERQAP